MHARRPAEVQPDGTGQTGATLLSYAAVQKSTTRIPMSGGSEIKTGEVVRHMIKTQTLKKTGETKVTFILHADDGRLPASVVGDFNGWDPMAHPFRKWSNGTFSVTMTVPPSAHYEFRYLGDNGCWFDEDPDGNRVTRDWGHSNSAIRG